jgi:hypothetical protein
METWMVGAAYHYAGADALDGIHHAVNKYETVKQDSPDNTAKQ